MKPMFRASLALSLIVSLLAVPLIMDQCATACEMNGASGVANAATCHHSTAPAARIGHTRGRCGHDHTGAVAIGAADAIRLARSSVWSLVATAAMALTADTMRHHRVDSDWSPPTGPGQPALIAPLRI
jgi:hypothetical protein